MTKEKEKNNKKKLPHLMKQTIGTILPICQSEKVFFSKPKINKSLNHQFLTITAKFQNHKHKSLRRKRTQMCNLSQQMSYQNRFQFVKNLSRHLRNNKPKL